MYTLKRDGTLVTTYHTLAHALEGVPLHPDGALYEVDSTTSYATGHGTYHYHAEGTCRARMDRVDGSTYTVWCEEWDLDQVPSVGVSRKLGTAQTVAEAKKLIPQKPTRDTLYHIVGNGHRWAGEARKWMIPA